METDRKPHQEAHRRRVWAATGSYWLYNMCIYIYIYIFLFVYIYIYIQRERDVYIYIYTHIRAYGVGGSRPPPTGHWPPAVVFSILFLVLLLLLLLLLSITITINYYYYYKLLLLLLLLLRFIVAATVSFHNFKSRNFKLSVSNPESKYVAYLFVLSQISNCQGLGRKNKHEILKTDHIVAATGSRPASLRFHS